MTDLYNTDIIALAADIAHIGALEAPQGTARKVSKLCGSWVEVDIEMREGHVTDFAIRIEACALGQASAGVLSQNIIGASVDEICSARDALFAMLKDAGPAPKGRFAGLSALTEVANYPARHISTLLAFDAALAAIADAKCETR